MLLYTLIVKFIIPIELLLEQLRMAEVKLDSYELSAWIAWIWDHLDVLAKFIWELTDILISKLLVKSLEDLRASHEFLVDEIFVLDTSDICEVTIEILHFLDNLSVSWLALHGSSLAVGAWL